MTLNEIELAFAYLRVRLGSDERIAGLLEERRQELLEDPAWADQVDAPAIDQTWVIRAKRGWLIGKRLPPYATECVGWRAIALYMHEHSAMERDDRVAKERIIDDVDEFLGAVEVIQRAQMEERASALMSSGRLVGRMDLPPEGGSVEILVTTPHGGFLLEVGVELAQGCTLSVLQRDE